mmetsp:Transcript_78098/g.208815  ORF Transcript_78098/g.208815 Transcript_78098/m.208815 type:complete len:202 (-) Transcript_78098:942-1547(-)
MLSGVTLFSTIIKFRRDPSGPVASGRALGAGIWAKTSASLSATSCLRSVYLRSVTTICFTITEDRLRTVAWARLQDILWRIHSMTSACTSVLRWLRSMRDAPESKSNSVMNASISSAVGGTRGFRSRLGLLRFRGAASSSAPSAGAAAASAAGAGGAAAGLPCCNCSGSCTARRGSWPAPRSGTAAVPAGLWQSEQIRPWW